MVDPKAGAPGRAIAALTSGRRRRGAPPRTSVGRPQVSSRRSGARRRPMSSAAPRRLHGWRRRRLV